MITAGETDLLTTGKTAKILGVTTQHVRNLCDRGILPYIHVGTHRRIGRSDLEAFRSREQGELLRDQLRNLWLHQGVAGKLVTNPDRVLSIGRRNLRRLRSSHIGVVTRQFDRWEQLLNGSLVDLFDVLSSTAPYAVELRQNSPFASVLSTTERRRILDAFRIAYRSAA